MRKGKISKEEQIIIKSMREDKKGYTDIAKELGCSKDRVKGYCQRNGLGGFKSAFENQWGDKTQREEYFREQFELLNPNFKYHSEYKGSEDYFKCECRICGHVQDKHADCGRPSRQHKELQCDKCNNIANGRKMVIELLNRLLKVRQKERDNEIRLETESLKRIANNHKHYLECKECGRMYFSNRERITCSERCSNKRGNRISEIRRRKRIVENGRVDWNISIGRLIKRDGDNCYLCGEKVDIGDYYIRGDNIFIAGNKYPSVDHLIPISKGGTHTWDNVKLAHRDCNSSKSNNTTVEIEDTGQVVMTM